jgi:uncharacterized protein (DUF2235 family)
MGRNLVVFFDGTWDDFAVAREARTNIVKLSEMLERSADQISKLSAGVGAGPLFIDKYILGALGKGVFKEARDAWNFLSDLYLPDDKIFIFGFSRGAYAARQLASMITRCGFPRGVGGALENTFEAWLKIAGIDMVGEPRQKVHFLGLFDCVPANQVLIFLQKTHRLNSNKLERGIDHFRHAVSRDERRFSFRPIIFENSGDHQSFAQPWFNGYHRDVGGGGKPISKLADIALWWMVREAYGCGLNFEGISCRMHRAGNGLSLIQAIDPDAKSVCSDYLTTKLGLRWIRPDRENNPTPDSVIDFINLDICPRCDEEMFDFLATDYGRQRLRKAGFNV